MFGEDREVIVSKGKTWDKIKNCKEIKKSNNSDRETWKEAHRIGKPHKSAQLKHHCLGRQNRWPRTQAGETTWNLKRRKRQNILQKGKFWYFSFDWLFDE